jgi:flavin reductase (DIM6/NTAB) family NADH-FMN oxidoreductase RutF
MSVSVERLRVSFPRLHRLFYPQVPAILSASSAGHVSAMPVVSYASVSVSPPLIAVACKPVSYTLKLVLSARAFSLCLVDRSQIHAMERLAAKSGRDIVNKLTESGLRHTTGTRLDIPVIEGADATLECQLHSQRRLGDHVFIVGLVKACYASDKFSDFWNFKLYRPILYTGWRAGLTTYGRS